MALVTQQFSTYSSELRWENLSVSTIATKKSPSKQILTNSQGIVHPGEFLAIMGPSGAGKTTLLNCLSSKYQKSLTITSGTVFINDHPIESVDYKSMIGFVPQDDILMESLTVRETLNFSASLTMKLTHADRNNVVNNMLSELGLTGCADSYIGGHIMRGISGGERKRTSIGVELIFNPPVLFLDEPTTGLDSFTAYTIIQMLCKLAKEKNSTIIATIHQPSSRIFNSFDRLLLLSFGNTIYIGKSKDAVGYISDIGYPIKQNYNPGDHFMDVLCSEKFTNIDFREEFGKNGNKGSILHSLTEKPHTHYHVGWVVALWHLIIRDLKHIRRNPIIVKAQIMKLIINFGLCSMTFANLGTDAYEINDRYGALFLLSNNVIMDTMFSTISIFQSHKPIFLREYFGRKYTSLPFLLSFIITRLPLEIVTSVGLYGLTYYVMKFNPDAARFFTMIIIGFLASFAAGSFGLLISVIAPSIEAASAMAPMMFLPLMLCGGYIVSFNNVPDWFILQYLSPFRYTFETTVRIDLKDNSDITSKISDQAIDSLDLPENYGEGIIALITLGVGIKVLAILMLKLTSRKI